MAARIRKDAQRPRRRRIRKLRLLALLGALAVLGSASFTLGMVSAIAAEVPRLGTVGLTAVDPLPDFAGAAPSVSGEIVYPIDDFYLTNPIARASPTLQRCSAEILHGQTFQEAAE